MRSNPEVKLSRRQTQIMDVIFRLGEATVREIQENLPQPPTAGAIRRMLGVLMEKGAIEAREDGARKVYRSTIRKNVARERALKRVVDTFFSGSIARAMTSLMTDADLKLSEEDRGTLLELIEKARKEGES